MVQQWSKNTVPSDYRGHFFSAEGSIGNFQFELLLLFVFEEEGGSYSCNVFHNCLTITMLAGFQLTDHESRFAIHLHYFAEHFLLFFMKFGDQFLKAHRSFNVVVEYCFTLILLTTARTLYLFTAMFFTCHSMVKYLLLSCLIA